MKTKIRKYEVAVNSHELYGVFVDDEEIETLVTCYPTSVNDWINNTEALNECRLHRLIVGLDVEWRPTFKANSIQPLATLQLCVGKSCLIFQIIHAKRIPSQLKKFLGDPDYTFVGVGIENDVRKLRNDYGLKVADTRDLRSWAAKELDRKELGRSSLKVLAGEVLGEDLAKPTNITLSSWDNRSLTKAQVSYACLDAYFSFEIGRQLSAWY
ncbi:DNA helicase [Handroanthus impetiginosus]|uniref:DNA helicase n=1 Tax=Handroanthus impetiginosus TaxID=429701 RepID=A0A2G9I5G2_9LAMI|nr:DNA helicase [Handroanthus impetiginosus]